MASHSTLRSIAILVVGIIIGAVSMWGYGTAQGIEPYVIEGYSSGTNYDGTAIGISQEVGGGGTGFSIAGVMWREFGGPWHDYGTPPSLEWPSYGQHIRMGVVDYEPSEIAPGSSAVVWLEVIDTDYMTKE